MAFLEVRGLHKSFASNHVLKGIDFDLEQGEVLSILGSSGGGKTTLLRCLNFLETATDGTISVAGQTIFNAADALTLTDTQLRENRLHFGLVFQNFNLFPQYTVIKNITLAMDLLQKSHAKANKQAFDATTAHAQNEAKGLALLEQVGLLAKKDAYPFQLSGGQCQRVAIARALALEPDILCFDEPTSALDPELTGEVLKVIRSLKSSKTTMIIVTHEMDFAKGVSDKVIFLSEGLIAEQGTPTEVFEHPKSAKMQAFLSKVSEPV